jgi:hypothetical protein
MKRRTFLEFNLGLSLMGLGSGIKLSAAQNGMPKDLGQPHPDLSISFWQQSQHKEDLFGLFKSAERAEHLPEALIRQSDSQKQKDRFITGNELKAMTPGILSGSVRITVMVLEPQVSSWANGPFEDFHLLARTVPPSLDPDAPEVVLWHFSNHQVLNAGSSNQMTFFVDPDSGIFLETSTDAEGQTRWPLYFSASSTQTGIPLHRGVYFIGLRDAVTGKRPDWSRYVLHSSDEGNQDPRKYLFLQKGNELTLVTFPYFALVVEAIDPTP